MIKKRLKGLLAMTLAGSIAATALQMSASATLENAVTIAGGDLKDSRVNAEDIGGNQFTGGCLQITEENTAEKLNLTKNNLWFISGSR
ncbi:MAG: hypothetical protein ACI4WS_04220 [Oscillospiraceae bacterium]